MAATVDVPNIDRLILPAVLELLGNGRLWDEGALASRVQQKLGFKKPIVTKLVIRTFVRNGIIDGATDPVSGVCSRIQLKSNSGGAVDPAEVKRLKELLEEEKRAKQTAMDAFAKEYNKFKAQAEAAEKAAAEVRAQERIVTVVLKSAANKVVKTTKGTFHKVFEQVLDLAQARENIFIYGPTGCGKTYLCKQLATSLGLAFAFVSCTAGMSEGVLGGRLLPTGNNGSYEYIISEFLKMFEGGGVFLLDEVDACDPNALLFINTALANGEVAVSNRAKKPYAKQHPDFICIAAANTLGTGADRMYPGRNKLDGATLDRFAMGKVYMDYDPLVEAKLCPDEELRKTLLNYRHGINEHRLERAMSTRFMQKAYRMTHPAEFGLKFAPWSMEKVNNAFFMGWREDEANKVKCFQP